MKRALILAVLLAPAAGAQESPPLTALEPVLDLVSAVPELEGLQMQRPVWAPGPRPRLVHEATDRSRRTLLRVVGFGDRPDSAVVPGTRSGRLAALGVGAERADSGAAWWDGSGFFFTRSSKGAVSVHFWDGVLRDVDPPGGRPVAVWRDAWGAGMLATIEDDEGLDLVRTPLAEVAGGRRLSRTPEEVEHSITPLGVGRTALIGTSQTQTRLLLLEGNSIVAAPVRVPGELLSLAAMPDRRLIAWVRRPERENYALMLIDVDEGSIEMLANDGFLPPGIAPRPAVSPSTGRIYYVRADEDAANPIMTVRPGETAHVVSLGTRGHQEVAVGSYPDRSGSPQDWLAVIAVGTQGDVANHLYVGLAPEEER